MPYDEKLAERVRAALKKQAGVEENEAAEKADTDSIQDENGKDDATEEAESGSEVPGDDGPGGWADEPANPNADTQQQGEH